MADADFISLYSLQQVKIIDPSSLIKTYEDHNTDTGNPNFKHFCSQCGSGLVIKPKHVEGRPDIAIVLSGTVDGLEEKEKNGWAPKTEVYCKGGKRSWFPNLEGGMKFDRMAPRA